MKLLHLISALQVVEAELELTPSKLLSKKIACNSSASSFATGTTAV